MSPFGDPGTTRAQGAAAAGETLAPGTVIDEWRLGETIASGGFGTVYQATEVASGRRGALKLLHAHLATSSEMVARFLREADVIARLRHPGIVELIGAGISADARPYLVMERLDGEDLSVRLLRRGRLAADETLAVIEPLSAALAHAHEHGVIHRDLKASNVFVCRDQARVVLLDFGVAKLSDALGLDLTASRQSLGTPACMAPEQIRGQPVDVRTDVYSLGGLAFHCLTGRLPFDDPSVTMVQYLHLHARRPRASVVAPLPPRVDEVLGRAMAIDPAERFPDVLAFYAALRAVLGAAEQTALAEQGDAVALMVSVIAAAGAEDAAALDDREALLPLAERALGGRGYLPAIDYGDAIVLVRRDRHQDAIADAHALAGQLDGRPGRHPRIGYAIRIHRGPVELTGARATGGALLDPSTWGLPDEPGGVWASSAVLGEPSGRFVR
jgi:serine/threonine-protein kinase